MYYGSGTVNRIAIGQPADAYTAARTGRTLRVHSLDGSTFLRERTPWPLC